MLRTNLIVTLIAIASLSTVASAATDDNAFKLALVDHTGQLSWSAEGFKIIESSAKPGGTEIGLRGQDASSKLTFLGFLFLVPEEAPLTSAKCLEGVMGPEKKSSPSLKVLGTEEISQPGNLPVSLVSYTAKGEGGKTLYTVRGFVANADICGDLEMYSYTPLSLQDSNLRKIFSSFQLNEKYAPQFKDLFLYAQILYQHHMYGPAAPVYEKALVKLNEDSSSTKTMKRVITDQAGMSYGMSGNIPSRARFLKKQLPRTLTIRCITTTLPAQTPRKRISRAQRNICRKRLTGKRTLFPAKACLIPPRMILSCLIETTKNSGRSYKGSAGSE